MQGINSNVTYYPDVDHRGSVSFKMYKVEKKKVGASEEIRVVEASGWRNAPTVLPAGFVDKCKGLQDHCKKKGWTFFSPETGLIK